MRRPNEGFGRGISLSCRNEGRDCASPSGNEILFNVLTEKRKLRFETPMKGKLKVAVQAFSETPAPCPTKKVKINAPR